MSFFLLGGAEGTSQLTVGVSATLTTPGQLGVGVSAVLQDALTLTVGVSAALIAPGTKTVGVHAVLLDTLTTTVDISALLGDTPTKTVGFSAVLRWTYTKTLGVSAVLVYLQKLVGVAAVLKKFDITKTVGVSARLGTLVDYGFWFARALPNGDKDDGTETQLVPNPFVEYPSTPAGKLIEAGGTVVFQQPDRNNRVYTWVWLGWPADNPQYQALWALIEPLRSRYRLMAGHSPYVYLREEESMQLRTIATPGTYVAQSSPWFKCRVLEVSRTLRTGGSSLVVYDRTVLTFVIDDVSFNDFG